MTADPSCRACGAPLSHSLVDLGLSPLANSYVPAARARLGEMFHPLHVFVCGRCMLAQIEAFEAPEAIFSDYAYFSSYSSSWVRHAERYAEAMIARFDLGAGSKVVEIASNDGYLLRHFVGRGIPVLGVEPAANVAAVAEAAGVPTEVAFFGAATGRRLREAGHAADLMAANNVLAHVPDILDFVAGFRELLKPDGVATFEFPHLLRLIEDCQFDTVYHEHFSYLSLVATEFVLERSGLMAFDVETLPTHGGSLRLFVCHAGADRSASPALVALRQAERAAGLTGLAGYEGFAARVAEVKCGALDFLIRARREGRKVLGYGAAAKGNTFLNYCGIGPELVSAVADRSPHKQGTLLPGSRIPVISPEALLAERPDYVLILPWNLSEEIAAQLAEARAWGCRFVTAIPEVRVF